MIVSHPSNLTRFTALAAILSLCGTLSIHLSPAIAQDPAPTMQDVLQSLEDTSSTEPEFINPRAFTPSQDREQPAATAPSSPEPDLWPLSTLEQQDNTAQPAPVIENINPSLAKQVAPQAPKAERAETPPAPPKPLVFREQKYVELQTLDKVTARTATLTVAVGETVAVGPLFMQVKTCQRSAPYEQPESAAFLQIWEATPKDILAKSKDKNPAQWVFSGWMFASSPALSAMDHPIYDIWVLNCKNAVKDSAAKSEGVKAPADSPSDDDRAASSATSNAD